VKQKTNVFTVLAFSSTEKTSNRLMSVESIVENSLPIV